MSFKKAKLHLEKKGYANKIQQFDVSSATVELAAIALGTDSAKIAKSLTFMLDEQAIMILCAGDAKIANAKYKSYFHAKAKMLSKDEVNKLIGHDIGGVCPFGIHKDVKVYLDESLKRFDIVYPAVGNANSAIGLTIKELEDASDYEKWIDVCKWE